MLAVRWRRWQRLAGRKRNARATRTEESSAKERRMEGKKGIGGKRAGHDEDEAEARRERGEERRLVVRKGRRRENSLPPPTYAAGGSYRHGLGGPWDCQTFARPSVALGFFIGNRPAIDPRAILSLSLSPPTVSSQPTTTRTIDRETNKTNSITLRI